MKLSELDYDLPPELIAQQPLGRRDESRLLVYDRVSGEVRHRRVSGVPGEVLLLERRDGDGLWEALARPTRRLRAGRRYGPVELVEHLGEGRWLLRLDGGPPGEAPLPPDLPGPLEGPS